jgi:protein-disulfide isomerase
MNCAARAFLLLLILGWPHGAWAQELPVITVAGQNQMLANPGTPRVGGRKPDLTIVEYFDYNCPFCKQLVPVLQELLAGDPKIALVYKDWPVLGDVSLYAASCALAAGYQGKYLAAHDAMIIGPHLSSNDQVDAILQQAGVNLETMKKDRTAHAREIAALLTRNDEESQALNLDGTPGLVVGRKVIPGVTDVNYLRRLVANIRQGK